MVAQDIVHEPATSACCCERIARGVLILDVGALRNPAEVRELSIEHPHTRLVLLGEGLSTTESAQLLAFGASACLAKDTQARDVRSAIHLASRGLQVMPRGAHDAEAAHATHSLLTRREGEVLQLLRESRTNAEIALALQIGVETVRTHARSIFRKLGVSSRRALTALPTPPPDPPAPSAAHPARRRLADEQAAFTARLSATARSSAAYRRRCGGRAM